MAPPLSIKSSNALAPTPFNTDEKGCNNTPTTKTVSGSQQSVTSESIFTTHAVHSENTYSQTTYSPVQTCRKPVATARTQKAEKIPPCTATDYPDVVRDAITEIRVATTLMKIYAGGLARIAYDIGSSNNSTPTNIRSEQSAYQQSRSPTTTVYFQPLSSQDECTLPAQLSENDRTQVSATIEWALITFESVENLLDSCGRLVKNHLYAQKEKETVEEFARRTKAIKDSIILLGSRNFDNKILSTGYGNRNGQIIEACNDPSKIAEVIQRFGNDGVDEPNCVKKEIETLSQEAKYSLTLKGMMHAIRNMLI